MTNSTTICQFVDIILDDYTINKKKIRVDFFKYFQSENIDRKSINDYISNYLYQIIDFRNEIDGALSGDKVLLEAYANFNKPELREFKTLIDRFVGDVEKYKDYKKITRKKKIKTPDQLVKGLHIYEDSIIINERKYTPVNKEKIIGAKSIFLFNVHTKDLLFLSGKSLDCVGSKIIGYDENLSGLKKIKKIVNTIDKVFDSKLIDCYLIFESLPNKMRPVPKTVSPNFMLLKVLN